MDKVEMSAPNFLNLDIKTCTHETKCTNPHDGRQLINEILPLNVDQLFTLLYTNSKFFLDFHTARKTTDLIQKPWIQDGDWKKREVTMTVAVTKPIGPKVSYVTQKQVILPCSRPTSLYGIDTESNSSGVPYSDSFYIETHTCLKRISDKETLLSAYGKLKFRKSVWGFVKNIIEKNCWEGMEEFYADLLQAFRDYSKEGEVKVVSMKNLEKQISLVEPVRVPEKVPIDTIHGDSAYATLILYILIVLSLLLLLNCWLYGKLWYLESYRDDELPKTKILSLLDRNYLNGLIAETKQLVTRINIAADLLKQTEAILWEIRLRANVTS